jgi:phosphinothricin acetyltransferase
MNVRNATETDLKAIEDIYEYYVINSTATFQEIPGTMNDRIKWFNEVIDNGFPVVVVETNGLITGWGSLSKFQERSGYRFCVENSIYVHQNHLRDGIGSAIMKELISRAKSNGYKAIIAKICSEQKQSIEFHEKFGFKKVGYLENIAFKFNRWLSVVIMQLDI